MKGCHHDHAVFLKEDAVLLSDFDIWLDDFCGGDSAKAYDNFRTNQSRLVPQPVDTGLLLLR